VCLSTLSEGTNETHDFEEGTIQKKRNKRSNVQAIFSEIMVYFIFIWNRNRMTAGIYSEMIGK